MNVDIELRSIIRTRRLVNFMLWFIVAGAVFYSLMTSTPLVSAHSLWSWSGWALGLLTDAAFILAISADAVLSKHGMTGGKWAVLFRWVTGLASLFLNTWGSVAARDWVGVAIHSIAPAVLICAAEVAPGYRRRFRELELTLSSSQVQDQRDSGSQSPGSSSGHSSPKASTTGSGSSSEVHMSSSEASSPSGSEPLSGSASGSKGVQVHTGSSSQVQVQDGSGSSSKSNAIREGFMNQKTASEVAREINVSPSYVSRKYRELREQVELTA